MVNNSIEKLQQRTGFSSPWPIGSVDTSKNRRPWVEHNKECSREWKELLGTYGAEYVLKDTNRQGIVLQIGSGTTYTYLMQKLIDYQLQQQRARDMVILTTNLEVMELGRMALRELPTIVEFTQLILTGGHLNASLHSLTGELAAAGVNNVQCSPDFVFFGARSIRFDGGAMRLLYHFESELTTQEAYATRPTKERLILCDHTKLSNDSGFQARVDAKAMLRHANKCTFVLTCPPEGLKNPIIERQVSGFSKMQNNLRKSLGEKLRGKDIVLKLLNSDGRVEPVLSLWGDNP